jgi:hypothetical protein
VKPVFATQLPNVSGDSLLAVFVAEDNAKLTMPGAQSFRHARRTWCTISFSRQTSMAAKPFLSCRSASAFCFAAASSAQSITSTALM